MSKWTHICGIIRIDHLPVEVPQLTEIEAIHLISDGAPEGSEGGLTFYALKTQTIEEWGFPAVWGSVSFVGDLRDFSVEDIHRVTEWLKKIPERLTKRQSLIRQAITLIEPERYKPVMLRFNVEKNLWEEIKTS